MITLLFYIILKVWHKTSYFYLTTDPTHTLFAVKSLIAKRFYIEYRIVSPMPTKLNFFKFF